MSISYLFGGVFGCDVVFDLKMGNTESGGRSPMGIFHQ